MTMTIFPTAKPLLQLAVCLSLAAPGQAQVIKPERDLTPIPISGGEIQMLFTEIDMNNAHPLRMISFFKPNVAGPAQQVPFEMGGDYHPFLPLRTGADCATSAVKTTRSGQQLELVYALRKGEWADSREVTFLVFRLESNDEGTPGTPPLYFKQHHKIGSIGKYCDVNMALENEGKRYRKGN